MDRTHARTHARTGEFRTLAVHDLGVVDEIVSAVGGEKGADGAAQDHQRRRRECVPARRFGGRLRDIDAGGLLDETSAEVDATGKGEPRSWRKINKIVLEQQYNQRKNDKLCIRTQK